VRANDGNYVAAEAWKAGFEDVELTFPGGRSLSRVVIGTKNGGTVHEVMSFLFRHYLVRRILKASTPGSSLGCSA
jgi:hypothetical protein